MEPGMFYKGQDIKLEIMMIRKYVDDVVLVEEKMIAAAILLLLERKKILADIRSMFLACHNFDA